MTNYRSVVNTAKNGKLIRAEIREYVLGMALVYGFCKAPKLAKAIYRDDRNCELRIRQCTFLPVLKNPALSNELWPYAWLGCITIRQDIVTAIRSYFKTIYEDRNAVLFYDTKKFRVYYKRLAWGPEKRITLKRTARYFWTDYLAMLFCLFGKHQCVDPFYIDLGQLHLYRFAKNREETDAYIRAYLNDIVKIYCEVYDGTIYFDSEERYRQFWDLVNSEAKRIYVKLSEGNYLGKDNYESKGTDAGRKVQGNRCPARGSESTGRYQRRRSADRLPGKRYQRKRKN